MYGLAEFVVRLLIRFGALAGFVALCAVLISVSLTLARLGFRPGPSALAIGVLIAMAALALPAWKGLGVARAAFAALDKPRPAPSGPYAIDSVTRTLSGPADDAIGPIETRIWFPKPNANAPLRRLIIFAPGVDGDRDQTSLIVADLASRGYVVAVFDDLSQTPAPPNESADARALRLGTDSYTTPEAMEASLALYDARVTLQAHKAIAVLERVAALASQANAPWGAPLDTARVGFAGYSFGGSTAAEAASLDPRFVAVANIDGVLYARAARTGVNVPYLKIFSDVRTLVPRPLRRDYEYLVLEREIARAKAQARNPNTSVVEVLFSEHAAFTDAYFERAHFPAWLELDPFRAQQIVRAELGAFLSANLPQSGPVRPASAPRVTEALTEGAR